jgi:hypothetical protein
MTEKIESGTCKRYERFYSSVGCAVFIKQPVLSGQWLDNCLISKQLSTCSLAEGKTMMTTREIELLPEAERAITRASHNYYRALLSGAPKNKRQKLRKAWLNEIQRCWPGLLNRD